MDFNKRIIDIKFYGMYNYAVKNSNRLDFVKGMI